MNTFIKKASIAAMAGLLPLSAAAEVSISGWINEGVTYFDDGNSSGIVQTSENGTTLGSRLTFSGSQEVGGGLTAGFEVILEPSSNGALLGFGSSGINKDENGHSIGVLGNSVNLSGGFGKVTIGLQSMPTDNIAVLEDPSLTLWSSISPVFVGNGTTITGLGAGATNATWGSFLQCGGIAGLGIGIDCNGIYRQGIRYDLPAFGPVTVAVGMANNDVYDVAAKYKGEFSGIKTQLALGYASLSNGANYGGTQTDNFQVQAGAMDPGTGIFGSIAYQMEQIDGTAAGQNDDTDAFWLKAGIKKAWNSLGDTSISMNYGLYSDQFGTGTTAQSSVLNANGTITTTAAAANPGITGSEVERIGVEVVQYFGGSFQLYGVWEMLSLDVDTNTAAAAAAYNGADDLNTFRLGAVYFF